MNLWPRVSLPLLMPSISKGTTLPLNRQRMECRGRTQRNLPSPQRMDFGQGKLRTISGTIVATTCFGGTAGLFDRRQVVGALLVIALLGLIDGSEPRRFEEAFDRGLRRIDARSLRSSRISGERDGRPSTTATRRRGVAKVLIALNSSPASPSAPPSSRARSSRARACMRAGISSENSSSRSSAMC